MICEVSKNPSAQQKVFSDSHYLYTATEMPSGEDFTSIVISAVNRQMDWKKESKNVAFWSWQTKLSQKNRKPGQNEICPKQ